MAIWRVFLGLALLLAVGVPLQVLAAREVEPNNSPEQATLVDPSQPIEGVVQDQVDYYKIVLAEDGRVDLLLDGYPPGADITLGVNGFQESDSEPLSQKQGGGLASMRLHFNAQERVGLIWVKFTFTETFCQELWCAARLTADGPWYTTRPSPLAPAEWLGAPVVEPPTYRLKISQPGMVAERPAEANKHSRPGYHHFSDATSGLSFDYPPIWQVTADPQRSQWKLQATNGQPASGMKIDLELKLRRDFPGSSAEKQLNLAERDLAAKNAEIRKQGTIEAGGYQAPYLVAVLPAETSSTDSKATARMQVIVPFPDYYCWVGYSGPSGDYAGAIGVFENLLQTLQLQPPPMKPSETKPAEATQN